MSKNFLPICVVLLHYRENILMSDRINQQSKTCFSYTSSFYPHPSNGGGKGRGRERMKTYSTIYLDRADRRRTVSIEAESAEEAYKAFSQKHSRDDRVQKIGLEEY